MLSKIIAPLQILRALCLRVATEPLHSLLQFNATTRQIIECFESAASDISVFLFSQPSNIPNYEKMKNLKAYSRFLIEFIRTTFYLTRHIHASLSHLRSTLSTTSRKALVDLPTAIQDEDGNLGSPSSKSSLKLGNSQDSGNGRPTAELAEQLKLDVQLNLQ